MHLVLAGPLESPTPKLSRVYRHMCVCGWGECGQCLRIARLRYTCVKVPLRDTCVQARTRVYTGMVVSAPEFPKVCMNRS